jgi:ParB family transcriptional regulator, chromosome partitioning protein
MKTLELFWKEQADWSQATFGLDSERGPIGPLKHLAKEAVEAQKDPTDLMEFVDCLFLTFDATRRAGFTYEQLLEGAWRKLEINKARQWTKPAKGDEPVEHDRSLDK